jgi:exonuclease SbcC
MRPLLLKITSFGPFVGTHEVDFGLLQGRSFFLIHGPTGSGKTTILDAICFALYGESSGAERSGADMRSDFAAQDSLTEVEFDFSLADKTYRVQRRPRQLRPSRRGTGTAEEPQHAVFYDISPDENQKPQEVALASGWNRVNEMIQKLLGFRSDQFRQVVMLPQGQFRRLLMADSKERQAIMQVLFQTGLYSRIEAYFKEQAKTVEDLALRIEAKKAELLQEHACTSTEELRMAIDKEIGVIASDRKQLEQITKDLAGAAEALGQAKRIAQLFKACAEARHELEQLSLQKDDIERQRRILEKGRKALLLAALENSLNQRQTEYKQIQIEHRKAAMELEQLKMQNKAAQEAYQAETDKEAERYQASRHLHWLHSLTPVFEQYQEARNELAAAEQQRGLLQEDLSQAEAEMTKIRLQREEINNNWQTAQQSALQVEVLKTEVQAQETIFSKRNELEQARQSLAKHKYEWKKAVRQLEKAEQKYNELKNHGSVLQDAWNQGQAALLATDLREGVPCPVCGSLNHPHPHTASGQLPDEKQLKEQQARIDLAAEQLNEARKNAVAIEIKLRLFEEKTLRLEAELGDKGSQTLAALRQSLELSRSKYQTTMKSASQEGQWAQSLALLEEGEKLSFSRLERLKYELGQAEQECASTQAIFSERAQHLPQTIIDRETLQKEQEQALKHCEVLAQNLENARLLAEELNVKLSNTATRVDSLLEKTNQARLHFDNESLLFTQELHRAGFKQQAEYEAARSSETKLNDLEVFIKQYDLRLHSAQDQLARCEAEVHGLQPPDLAAIQTRHEQLQTERDRIHAEFTLAEERLKKLNNDLITVGGYEKQLEAVTGQYRVLGRIADVANGKNPKNVTFQRFVLGALLDDVILRASERLSRLSKGRFILNRSQDLTRANAAGGLNIEVYDHYTSTTRPVANLSGGESFLASLALALGLAEVVQSYSGGTYLEAMFIDEGFGSLDADSLDEAVRILFSLQEQGRLVGIISHIDELKERIDARLEVKKSEFGSSLSFHVS